MTVEKRHQVALQAWRRVLSIAEAHGYRIILARAEQRAKYANQRAEAERDLRLAEERSHSATKGHLTRAKKRHRAGLCPCCNRQFQDLVRHMASKHPEEAAKR